MLTNGSCAGEACTDEAGDAFCSCDKGFVRLANGTCAGSGRCGKCPVGAACAVAFDWVPYCICPAGYNMTTTGCISGAPPTVSGTSYTFYDQRMLTATSNTYTMRIEYNGCTNIPASIASNIRASWRIHHVSGGLGNCTSVNGYAQEGCVGAFDTYKDSSTLSATSATYKSLFPFRSFICVH
ncbi:unnamed protein product [Closterium sp. Yama58-4]|nr:unnamed protein product [Closterium sp. Yama58-4]